MTYTKIWEAFKTIFPEKAKGIKKFSTTRLKNTITFEMLHDSNRYLFTYNAPNSWQLKTITM